PRSRIDPGQGQTEDARSGPVVERHLGVAVDREDPLEHAVEDRLHELVDRLSHGSAVRSPLFSRLTSYLRGHACSSEKRTADCGLRSLLFWRPDETVAHA